ncbi:hypothetical protein Tco_1245307 [Tanacetum coccineum]
MRPNLGVLQIDIKSKALLHYMLTVVLRREQEDTNEGSALPADASPTTLSSDYIVDFNPKEDEEDPEEDLADHPVDEGDNDDNESSDDDDNDDDVVKDEEEEVHLALANLSAVLIYDLVPSS